MRVLSVLILAAALTGCAAPPPEPTGPAPLPAHPSGHISTEPLAGAAPAPPPTPAEQQAALEAKQHKGQKTASAELKQCKGDFQGCCGWTAASNKPRLAGPHNRVLCDNGTESPSCGCK